MDEKRKIKPMIIIVVVLSLLIVGVIVWFAVIEYNDSVDAQKKKLTLYDSYANTVEDYSFVLGIKNTIKCQIAKSDDLERLYIYNAWNNPDDKIDFHCTLIGDDYSYEKQELFHPVSSFSPFPEKALPHNINVKIKFSHYKCNDRIDGVKWLESPHNYLAVSLKKCINYNDILKLREELIGSDYAIKFCWVDTYLPDEISDDSVFSMGLSYDHNIVGYEDFNDSKRVYGFLFYDHYYNERDDYDDPLQKFLDIVTADHDVQDNFMASELTTIRNNLEQKEQLNVDSLEIIGVVLEKTERCSFIMSDAEELLNNYDFIKCIIS